MAISKIIRIFEYYKQLKQTKTMATLKNTPTEELANEVASLSVTIEELNYLLKSDFTRNNIVKTIWQKTQQCYYTHKIS